MSLLVCAETSRRGGATRGRYSRPSAAASSRPAIPFMRSPIITLDDGSTVREGSLSHLRALGLIA
jgi:hypothetical protein